MSCCKSYLGKNNEVKVGFFEYYYLLTVIISNFDVNYV